MTPLAAWTAELAEDDTLIGAIGRLRRLSGDLRRAGDGRPFADPLHWAALTLTGS